MPNPYSGFAALGDAIVGGPQHEAEANYPKYLKQSADGYSALDKAAIVRAQRIAREGLPAAIAADPGLAGHADLAGAVLGMSTGQPNLGTFTKGLGDMAEQEMDRQALEALQAGDLKRAQQLSAVKTDKILPTLGAGGKAVFTPVTGDVAVTPLGEAAIGADEASAAQRNAAAGREQAHADVYAAQAAAGGYNPNTGRKPPKTLSPIEAKTKMDFILAKATEMAKDGKADAYVQAWIKNEAMKAGIPMEPLGDEVPTQTMPGFQSFDDIPPAARERLKEGVKTKFGNGQVWTLVNGQPTRAG